MNTLKALFSSTLALIVVLIAGLFLTSCSSGPGGQAESTLEKPRVHEAAVSMIPHPDTADMHEVAPETTSVDSPAGITVLRAETCTGIEGHEPVGVSSSFSRSVGKVWLYTKIAMPAGESGTIRHVWKFEGKVISTVTLDVRGPSFRTRSYKTITERMAGNWTVEVETEDGSVLETVSFTVG